MLNSEVGLVINSEKSQDLHEVVPLEPIFWLLHLIRRQSIAAASRLNLLLN